MEEASDRLEFERAAALRDKVRAIERTMEAQKMAGFARTEQDVLGLARRDGAAAVQLFAVRGGKLIGRDVFLLENVGAVSDGEALAVFVRQYYAAATSVPPTLVVPSDPADAAELQEFLSALRGARVRFLVPQRGERRQLVALAAKNADEHLAREQARWLADEGKTRQALEELADALGLPVAPARIEGYDISTIQGTNTVGSMVVFEDGRPRTGEYRRFRVQGVRGPDDVASHQEVLRRRFRRASSGEEGSEEELRWRMPDLVVIDGGKGQLGAARAVLDQLGLHDLPVAALAKEREELFVVGRATPIVLPVTSPALYLVQRLRDEAHRFAVTYHRKLRAKQAVRSAFDDLPGVGPKRKRALLRVFGSAKRVREAPIEQIAAVPGIGRSLAERIKAGLEAG
jgi:excinuclease ABC subunit C